MKWFLAGVALVGVGIIIYFTIMFNGPRMREQQHIREYQQSMPLPPRALFRSSRMPMPCRTRTRPQV